MIKEFLEDMKWMSMIGMVLFTGGFIFNSLFTIFLGTTMTLTGVTIFSLVDKEYNKLKERQ